jgi:dihydrofolate synthase/folylpolyglutamate synthase
MKFGLREPSRRCAAALRPSPEPPSSRIIVAGTNGKGSVTAMVDTALRAAGIAARAYTSPHLQRSKSGS